MSESESARMRLIEQGDIYFLDRPRAEKEPPSLRNDTKFFYVLLSPDQGDVKRRYRLFMVRRKSETGSIKNNERIWMVNIMTTNSMSELKRELRDRAITEARPVAEGRYEVFDHHRHTELAYVIEEQTKSQLKKFEINGEAKFIVVVKNPEIRANGYGRGMQRPGFPEILLKKLGTRSMAPVTDPRFLDYKYAQFLLVDATANSARDELGLEIDEATESSYGASVCEDLRLCKPQTRALLFRRAFS